MPALRPAIRIHTPTAGPASVRTTPPRLAGPDEALQRVMSRLGRVVDPVSGVDIVRAGRIVALDIGADEATLTLRIGIGHCDSAHHVAEEAFDVLRAELPDTDLYLRHLQVTPCASSPEAP